MSQCTANIICDSVSSVGIRLTTYVLKYPRLVHSELMTHRVFSRNASSSRAIPVNKQIQECINNPVIPTVFYKNQKGMQGGEPVENQEVARGRWLEARDHAVRIAEQMNAMGIHKQHVNRILEPFAFISVVLTSTDFDNFFALRCHKDADPTIKELADVMWKEYQNSSPNKLNDGEWHLPFIDSETIIESLNGMGTILDTFSWTKVQIKRSVARCARVSYKLHDGTNTTLEKDLALYDILLSAELIHASPAEHQAMAVGDPNIRSGNFRGWVQYRKTLKNENITNF